MNGRNVTERSHERRFLKEKIFGTYSFINVTNGREEFDSRHSRKNMIEVYVVAEIVSKLYKGKALTPEVEKLMISALILFTLYRRIDEI